jgi:universal stress protein E
VTHLPRGAHHDGIIATAEDLDAGLVVMGTSSRLGLSALLMGNSVEIVLDAASCGVLAIKPESFRTPVSIPQMEMGRPAISADSR